MGDLELIIIMDKHKYYLKQLMLIIRKMLINNKLIKNQICLLKIRIKCKVSIEFKMNQKARVKVERQHQ